MSKKIAYTLRGFDCHGKPMTETITMHKYNLWERFVRWCKRSRFRHINTIIVDDPGYCGNSDNIPADMVYIKARLHDNGDPCDPKVSNSTGLEGDIWEHIVLWPND